MSILLDKTMTYGLMKIASAILSKHFFYDQEGIEKFCLHFSTTINQEHLALNLGATHAFKYKILTDDVIKKDFTAHFVGYHLCQTLVEKMDFGTTELDQFETILMKYIKVCEPNNDDNQSHERESHRNPFTAL